MFARKNQIPKSQLPDKCKYTEHYFHSKPKTDRIWSQKYIQVVSIDPAVKNLAIRIERWNFDKTIVPIFFNRFKLLEEYKDTNDYNDYNLAFVSSLKLLKTLTPYFNETHIFVIEKQLPVNYKVVRISQHLITFIATTIVDNKFLASIYEVDPKLKGEIFGAGKINEAGLKDWSVTESLKLLESRKDNASLEILQSHINNKKSKGDDLADTIMQTCALFYHITQNTAVDNLWEILNNLINVSTDLINTPMININIK
jgi:hypothetical protein